MILKLFNYIFLSLKTILSLLNKSCLNHYDVLIVSNGMSMSGAPLVLQEIVQFFQEQGYNPLLIFEHDGKLREQSLCDSKCCFFFESLIQKIVLKHNFKYIFVNTIASYKWICCLEIQKKKYNLWIHEGEEYFAKFGKEIPRNIVYGNVFCVSSISRDCLHSYCPGVKSTILCYPFLQNNYNFEFPQCKNEKIILHVGSICKRKNQLELLNAIDLLNSSTAKNIKVVFVGSSIETDYDIEFKKNIQRFSNVSVIDYIKNDELMKYYNQIYMCICTSIDDPMPVTVTEAIFSNRLVIVSSGTGQYGILKNANYPFTYVKGDLSTLKEEIENALNLSEHEYKECVLLARDCMRFVFSKDLFINVLNELLIETEAMVV